MSLYVIVATYANSTPNTVTGDVHSIIIVDTTQSTTPNNYGPNPGHDGWGSFVGTFC